MRGWHRSACRFPQLSRDPHFPSTARTVSHDRTAALIRQRVRTAIHQYQPRGTASRHRGIHTPLVPLHGITAPDCASVVKKLGWPSCQAPSASSVRRPHLGELLFAHPLPHCSQFESVRTRTARGWTTPCWHRLGGLPAVVELRPQVSLQATDHMGSTHAIRA